MPATQEGGVALRFRMRLTIGVALASFAWLVAPVGVVLLTDPRCYYYASVCHVANDCLDAQHSVITYEYCASDSSDAELCPRKLVSAFTSSFKPHFSYRGEHCASAMVEIYAPVYLQSAILAAVLPALLELVVVPWSVRRAKTSVVARRMVWALEQITLNANVVAELLEGTSQEDEWTNHIGRGSAPSSPNQSSSHGPNRNPNLLIDELAQEVVERGFGQLVSTLLLALTFGLAAPMAGLALGAAAGVQLVHHLCVLGQVVEVARLRHGHRRPKHVELHGCDRVPWGCGAVVAFLLELERLHIEARAGSPPLVLLNPSPPCTP